jgi:hypothetical protein
MTENRASVSARDVRRHLTGTIAILSLGFVLLYSAAVFASGTGVPESRIPENLAGLPSGKVTVDATQIGDTRFFWAYAQGFFQGYYPLSATCQDVGEHAYLFTEDAYLNDISSSMLADSLTLFAATTSGLYKSLDGGLSWQSTISGLPDMDGTHDSFDSSNYNRRAESYCLFSRAEYGASFDTIWVGTVFGPFWSTAGGDTFVWRAQRMTKDPETNTSPPTYDILGHPEDELTLWAATEDGVYMTRNANRWTSISAGLPPGEGSIWPAGSAYALDYDNDLLFVNTAKGVFYGEVRPLGTSPTSNVIVSWKPLGGTVSFSLDSSVVFVDTTSGDTTYAASEEELWLLADEKTSHDLTISVGQYLTVVDVTQSVYWFAFVDETPAGLSFSISDDKIFYYSEGTSAPSFDYTTIDLENLMVYAYSQNGGDGLYVEVDGDGITVWSSSSETGLYSYQFTEDNMDYYDPENLTIANSHNDTLIYQIAKRGEQYYFATDQGLFSAADPHGEWTRLTGYLMNNTGTDSVMIDARAVAFGAGDLTYVGSHMGGFLRSEDGTTFAHSNTGLLHLNGTLDQLAMFLDEFENTTPADPDKGIYETCTEWWGDLPEEADIDDDPKVTILFLNIDDQYYLSTGDGTYISGYFDGRNEYPLSFEANSNQAEMFYLDTDPQWINRAGAAACNQMFNLINWNQDPFEDIWIREGLASFSQHVAGYSMAEGILQFPTLNMLTNWGDFNRDEEHKYSFMLMEYFYEQLFGDDGNTHTITEIAASPYQGINGLGRLICEKTTGETSSDDVDYTPYFEDFFVDFVVAGAIDNTSEDFYGGKYGFTGLDSQMGAASYNWYWTATTTPPLYWHLPFWSTRVIQVKDNVFFNAGPNNENIIDNLVMNGDDRNHYRFFAIITDTTAPYPDMPLDELNLFEIPVDSVKQKGSVEFPEDLWLTGTSDPPNYIRVMAICTSDSGDFPSCYVLGDDFTPPENIYLTVAQNPIDDRYLDIYSFSEERIMPDGGQLYRIEDLGLTELEGPTVTVSGAFSEETGQAMDISLDQDVFYANPAASTYSYHIAYYLEGMQFPADLEFMAYGEDISGNEKESDVLDVTVDFIESPVGGTLVHSVSGASLNVPPFALAQDAYVLLSVSSYPVAIADQAVKQVFGDVDPSHYPVGPVVSAGSPSLELAAPVTIEVPYDPALGGDREVGVYRLEGDNWVYVGGVADPDRGFLTTYSWKMGQFQAFSGPLNDMQPEMPHRFELSQNYPNPFNPSTQIEFELTRAQHVTLSIYNITGQKVGTLADRVYDAGRHSMSLKADKLASGVYFLRLEAEEGILYRKMILLK